MARFLDCPDRMTLRQYISIMIVATLLCLTAWGFVLMNVDPFEDAGIGILFFYVTLFFSLIGSLSLVSFIFLYHFSSSQYAVFHDVQRSFLIGLSGSTALVTLLYLQAQAILSMWNVIVFAFICLFFLLFKLSTVAYKRS